MKDSSSRRRSLCQAGPHAFVGKGDIRLAGFLGGESGGVQPRNGVHHRHAAVRLICRAYKPIDRSCGVRLGPCRCCPRGFVRLRISHWAHQSQAEKELGQKRQSIPRSKADSKISPRTVSQTPAAFLAPGMQQDTPSLAFLEKPTSHFPPHTANCPCLDTGRSVRFLQ
jgi:hypothetical protein